MFYFKKSTLFKFALFFSLMTGPANHALALDVTVPVPANDPLIQDAVNQVITNGGVVDMRNNMRTQIIATQAPLRPMQPEMQPLMTTVMQQRMRDQIMPALQAELSDPNNPNGMVALFAPPVFQ